MAQVEKKDSEESYSSVWLNFSPVETFISRHLSKALGLVPLFDPVTEEERTWPDLFKELVSRLYHWTLLLFLLYFLVKIVQDLSLCHFIDGRADEGFLKVCDSGTLGPLAVDMALLTGAILVLISWGGVFNYSDPGPKIS